MKEISITQPHSQAHMVAGLNGIAILSGLHTVMARGQGVILPSILQHAASIL